MLTPDEQPKVSRSMFVHIAADSAYLTSARICGSIILKMPLAHVYFSLHARAACDLRANFSGPWRIDLALPHHAGSGGPISLATAGVNGRTILGAVYMRYRG